MRLDSDAVRQTQRRAQENRGFLVNRAERRMRLFLPYGCIAGAGLLRLEVSHSYNLVPIFSCLLFFAALRPAREFGIPLLALIGVDIFLTTHQYHFPLTIDSVVTWAWYLVVMLLGAGLLKGGLSMRLGVACSLALSISYFVISNFIVWAIWNMYPRTLYGLWTCYLAAVPFFRNSLISELLCSLLLFGLGSQFVQFLKVRTAPAVQC